MTISLLQPLPSGNAIRLFLTPTAGARSWRVLRRTADTFTGPDDAGAVRVADESTDTVIVDAVALVNGVSYFYRAYDLVAGGWVASATATVVPAASYGDDDCDPRSILCDRLVTGLAVEIERQTLTPANGTVPVLMAPYATLTSPTLPLVTVSLEAATPTQRGLGEVLADARLAVGGWQEAEGWIDQVTLAVVGVSLNPDERHALQRAIKRVILTNLSVFKAYGLDQIGFTQHDEEDLTSHTSPLYKTAGSFICTAPSFTSHTLDEIVDVISLMNADKGP